jgi:hypothetical protein
MIELVRTSKADPRVREMMAEHYSKPKGFVGRQLIYLICYAGDVYGAIAAGTAWARKAIEENRAGKTVVLVYPVDKWILMLIAAGAEVRNLGDVKWLATEDGSAGKGTGRHIAAFVLKA